MNRQSKLQASSSKLAELIQKEAGAVGELRNLRTYPPLPQGSSTSYLEKPFFGLLWTSLVLEVAYFFLQFQTSGRGAKHAEREFFGDEAVDTYPVKQLTGAVVLFAALVNLATDLWSASPNVDTRPLVNSLSQGFDTIQKNVVFNFYLICAAISFSIGGLANGAGIWPYIVHFFGPQGAVYVVSALIVFVPCWLAGVLYYLANARCAMFSMLNEIQHRAYPDLAFPESTSLVFRAGYVLRLFLAILSGAKADIVRSFSFCALVDILKSVLGINMSPELNRVLTLLVFSATFVSVLPRSLKVFTQFNSQEALRLEDEDKQLALQEFTYSKLFSNEFLWAEVVTTVSLYFLISHFSSTSIAVTCSSFYFCLCFLAIFDLVNCQKALDIKNGVLSRPQSQDAELQSAVPGRTFGRGSDSSRSSSGSSNDQEEGNNQDQTLTTADQVHKFLEQECLASCVVSCTHEVEFAAKILTFIRGFSRSLQLLDFVKILQEFFGLDFPVVPTVGVVAGTLLSEYLFAADNIQSYLVHYHLAKIGLYVRLGGEEGLRVPFQTFGSWFTYDSWRYFLTHLPQYLPLLYTGVHDFTLNEWHGILTILKAGIDREITQVEVLELPHDQESVSSVNLANMAQRLFSCCRNSRSSLQDPLLPRGR